GACEDCKTPSISKICASYLSRCVDQKRKPRVTPRGQAGFERRSGCRTFVADCEASLFEPLFEQRKPVVTPERFAREQEEGHAEHVVRGCLFLTTLVGRTAFPGQILEIVPIRQAKVRDQPSHSFRLIGFELAQKEFFEGQPAKVEQWAVGAGEYPADRRGGGVIDFQRAADPETARFRPAPSIHVGVFDLVLGIDAALTLALHSQLERNPSYPYVE